MKIFVKNTGYPSAIIGGDSAPEGYTERTADEYRAIVDAAGPVPVQPVGTPAPQVPAQVTNAQFRAALIDAGILPSQIDAAIAAIPDNTMRLKASEWWQYANYIERGSGYVASFAPGFNLSPAQVDALFISASTQGT